MQNKLFLPWTRSRHSETALFRSRINFDAAGHGQDFQPYVLDPDFLPYKGMPLFSGDTGEYILPCEEFEYFKAWFNTRKGKQGTFLFKNYSDYTVTATPDVNCIDSTVQTQGVTYPATGNGANRGFTLLKAYQKTTGAPADNNYRLISYPVAETLRVYLDGILITSWVLTDEGAIAFSVAPPSGAVVTFSCEYLLLVRFDQDTYSATVINAKDGEEKFKISPIPIVEVPSRRMGAPVVPPPVICDPLYDHVLAHLPLDLENQITEIKNGLSIAGTTAVMNNAALNPFGDPGVLEFDGTQALRLASSTLVAALHPICLEFWIKQLVSHIPGETAMNVFEGRISSTQSSPLALYAVDSGACGVGWPNPFVGSAGAASGFVIGQWQYWNLSISASQVLTLHIDGNLIATVPGCNTLGVNTTDFYIGGFKPDGFTNAGSLIGYMFDWRVSNVVRDGSIVPTEAFGQVPC